jgi:hypothetical protein
MTNAAFESPGPGGALSWKEREDGHWKAEAMGLHYEVIPDKHGSFRTWVRVDGEWKPLGGRHTTLGGAFGEARRFADQHAEMHKSAAEHSDGELHWKREGDREKVARGRKGKFSITSTQDGKTLLSLDGHAVDSYENVGQAEKVANHLNALHEAPTAAERVPVVHEASGKPMLIEKKGDHDWRLFIHGEPVVNVSKPRAKKPELSFRGRPNFVEGAPTYKFKSKSEAEGVAHQVGRYMLKLGDMLYSYVDYKDDSFSMGKSEAREDYAHVPRDVEAVRAGRKHGQLRTAADVYAYCGPQLLKESQEVFVCCPVDIHGRPMAAKPFEIARGERDRVSVGISDVLRPVVTTNALAFFVVHPHPSGECHPSEADIELTKTIDKAAQKVGLVMLDHFVCADGQIYSIREGKLYDCR